MAMERSVLEPTGSGAKATKRVGDDEEQEQQLVTGEARLWQALMRRRDDDDALQRLLGRMASVDRQRALLALIGVVGAERARVLSRAAWGRVPPLLGTEVEAAGATTSGEDEAGFDLHLARSVHHLVAHLVERGHDALVDGVMDHLQSHVANAAASLVRGDAGLAGAGMLVSSRRAVAPVGQGPGAALMGAAERHAGTLMRRSSREVEEGSAAPASPVSFDEALREKGAGQPLPAPLRVELEARFGLRLDGVRLHTDEVAARAARAISAHAFTLGEDIFFAEGQFAPSTEAGRRLLTHEVTHVVQGYQGRVPSTGERRVSQPDEPLEREAEATAGQPGAAAAPLASAASVAPVASGAQVAFRDESDGGGNAVAAPDSGAQAQAGGATVTTGVLKFDITDPKKSEPDLSGATLIEFADKWNKATGNEGAKGAMFFVKPEVSEPTGYKFDDKKGVQEATIKVTWTWKVPKWKEGTATPDKFHKLEIKAYNDAHGTMVAHEDGHVAIDRKVYTSEAIEALRGKQKNDFIDGISAINAKGDADNQTYDTGNDHGVNQGNGTSTHLRIPSKQEMDDNP